MKQIVSFDKLKLTNNLLDDNGHVSGPPGYHPVPRQAEGSLLARATAVWMTDGPGRASPRVRGLGLGERALLVPSPRCWAFAGGDFPGKDGGLCDRVGAAAFGVWRLTRGRPPG